MAFCKIMLIGNLGRDPEMRYTPNGRPVTQINVAVSNSKPDGQGGWVDEGTDWFRVSVFGDRAERAAEQLRKGNRVFVEGRFKTREFEGNDGQKRTSLDVTADNVISLERRTRDEDGTFSGAPASGAPASGAPASGTPASGTPATAGRAPGGFDEAEIDDLPF
jgi:single-strand DNA-binding protein